MLRMVELATTRSLESTSEMLRMTRSSYISCLSAEADCAGVCSVYRVVSATTASMRAPTASSARETCSSSTTVLVWMLLRIDDSRLSRTRRTA